MQWLMHTGAAANYCRRGWHQIADLSSKGGPKAMQAQTRRRTCSLASVLLERYRSVRAATLALTAPLSPEDMMVQSCAEASPAKWHLAHTTWFFETFVLREFRSEEHTSE